nr:hypothetical protein BaRGS_032067 [Batillaria attramentaria]
MNGVQMKISFKLGKDVLVAVIEQTLLLVLVLCRWALPRGDITRQELSQLLFLFLSIGSDIMQLFELFNQKAVRNDPTLTYITLGVWSVSLLQLTIVLTATRTPSRARVDHVPQPARSDRLSRNNPKGDGRGPKKQPLTQMIFTTEIWSLALGVLVQDGPYAAIRIYTMVKHNLITYSIIFFVSKNVLVICLACYRLVALCLDKPTEHDTIDGDGHTRDARSSAMFVTSSVTHGRDNMGNTFRA